MINSEKLDWKKVWINNGSKSSSDLKVLNGHDKTSIDSEYVVHNITELFDSNLSAMKNLYNEFFTSNCGSCVAHTTEEECNKHSECNWNGSVCQNK